MTFPILMIVSTVGLTGRIFAILIALGVRAAPFPPINQGATAAIAAIDIVVVDVVVVVVVVVVVIATKKHFILRTLRLATALAADDTADVLGSTLTTELTVTGVLESSTWTMSASTLLTMASSTNYVGRRLWRCWGERSPATLAFNPCIDPPGRAR